jgi:nucleoside-diphosphate-sugar epimerase
MRVFVTGISSEMGQRIAEALVTTGHDVVGLTRKTAFRLQGCLVVVGSLETPTAYSNHLAGTDLIIHVAGITHSDSTERYYAVNADAGSRLISLAETHGVKRFIYVSTRAIGPGCGAYGESKRMLEKRLRTSDLDWIILRVAEVYGITKHEGINALIGQILRQKIVLIPGNGEFMLTPIHVGDVVATVCAVVEAPAIRMKTYTLCGPNSYSIKEFISVVCQIVGSGRMGITVPLFLIRLAAAFKRVFPLPFPVTGDQVQRLAVPKKTDFSEAGHDLGFHPMAFETWFQSEVNPKGGRNIVPVEKGVVRAFPGIILFKGSAVS